MDGDVCRLARSLVLALCFSALPIFGADVLAADSKPSTNPAAQTSPAERQLVAQAESAYHDGKYQLAATLLRQALKISPNDVDTRIVLGRLLLALDDGSSSERELRQAMHDGGPTHQVLVSLFQTMLARHEAQDLLNEFGDPAPNAKSPKDADVLEGRAQALLALNRVDDAKVAASRALSIHRSVSALLIRAQVALAQNDRAEATSLTDEALKLDPKDGHALVAKLNLLLAANNNTEALTVAEQILRLFPRDLATRALRIDILLKLKQDDKAKQALSALVSMAPKSPVAQYYQAVFLERSGDSIGAWRIAQTLPPSFTQLKPAYAIEVSKIAIKSGNSESAAAILGATLAKTPNSIDLAVALADVRMSQDSPEGALAALSSFKDSTDPRVLDLLAQAYLNPKLQKYDLAVAALKRLQNPKRTVALLSPVLRLESGQTILMDAIAVAKLQLKDPRGATELLTRAHQLDANNGEITFHLVQALDAGGDRKAAKDLLGNLLHGSSNFADRPAAEQLATRWR